MGIIAKTLTRGFRNSFFRNQPVHQFYGHLQAVLREISPAGELDNLFARPEFAADSQALPAEIEWSTTLDGSYEMFKDLPPDRQKEMANYIGSCLEKIKKYADTKQGKSGKEKDYAEYLKAVAVSPDLNQIFVVKNQPVLVHWGFTCENGSHPGQGMYAGWDEFIAEIHRKAEVKADGKTETRERIVLPPEPPPEVEPQKPTKPQVVAAAATAVAKESVAAKAAEPAKKPEQALAEKKPKRVVACGLGDYEWVKWLAIILAIIILLLLLLRIIAPQQSAMSQMPMGGISIMGGGDGGGGFGGAGGSGAGGAPGSKCPQCGHMAPKEQPQAPVSQQPSQQQTQQGAPPQAQPVSQPVQQTQPMPQQAQPVSQPIQQNQPMPQQAQPLSQPVQQPSTTVPQNTSQTPPPPQTEQPSGQQTAPGSDITPVQQPVSQPVSQPLPAEAGH